MFLKARQWLRMMLLALAAQIGNLAKVGTDKGYEYNHESRRQLRQVEKDFKQGLKSSLSGPSKLPLDDLSDYGLSLTGNMEPASNLPTVNLDGSSNPERLQLAASKGPAQAIRPFPICSWCP